MRVLDAGCGYGRNLVYLLRHGCEVLALDANPNGVEHVRRTAQSFNASLPAENFQIGAIEQMPFPDQCADVVLCSSVLHFSRDAAHFQAMLAELWRVLRPGGLLFTRIGSRIGMNFAPLGNGSAWFLVDEAMLMAQTAQWNATLVDPLKTTIVQNHRCMTTWVLRKPAA